MERPVFLWERLPTIKKPVVLYGMGDGAGKVLDLCAAYGVPVAGVFASDEFVRGQSFRGFPVRTLAALERELGELAVLLCFATGRPEVMAAIDAVAARHTLFAPDLPLFGGALFTPALVREKAGDIRRVSALLADGLSRRTLEELIACRLDGDLSHLRRCAVPREEGLALLAPGEQDFFVDAGAYTGDTLEEFLRAAGGRCRGALALEPDRRNFRRLEANARRLWETRGLDPRTLRCVNAGAWSRRESLPFRQRSGRNAALGGKRGGAYPLPQHRRAAGRAAGHPAQIRRGGGGAGGPAGLPRDHPPVAAKAAGQRLPPHRGPAGAAAADQGAVSRLLPLPAPPPPLPRLGDQPVRRCAIRACSRPAAC